MFLSTRRVVSWHIKLIGNASLSNSESEYMAFSMAGQEASFLRQLHLQMKSKAVVPRLVRLLLDNQPAIVIVHNIVYHARSNQILALKGVKPEATPPRTPKRNGVAERRNRTLKKRARLMMLHARLGGGC